MNSTITPEQQASITDLLSRCHLPSGLGSGPHDACSIAAINLALTGELKDEIPPCMSEVIGKWIITIQDAMPEEMRNSKEWKSLLPLAAGTGRDREPERLAIILDWMWERLAGLQPLADKGGFGDQWRTMLLERTDAAARAAYAAARAAYVAARAAYVAVLATDAADRAVDAAVRATDAADRAARAADRAARAADRAARADRAADAARATDAADAAADAARATDAADAAARAAVYWQEANPCALLARLIQLRNTMGTFDPRKLQIAVYDAGDSVLLVTTPGEAHPIAEIDCNVDQPATIATRIASCVQACVGLDIPADVKPGALAELATTAACFHAAYFDQSPRDAENKRIHLSREEQALRNEEARKARTTLFHALRELGAADNPCVCPDCNPVSHEGAQTGRIPANAENAANTPKPATMDDVWALLPNPRDVGAAEYRITYELIEDSADSVEEAIAIAREARDHAQAILAKLEGRS